MNGLAKAFDELPREWLSTWAQQIVQNMLWRGGTTLYKYWFHLECQGLEHLPQNEGYIIAANHTSHLDGPAIVAARGRHMRQVYSLAAKDYFFNQPIKAWACRYILNMIAFNRRGKFFDCLPTCQQLISERKVILFFPEGTRSVNGELQQLKLGIGLLVAKLDVPVIPAYITGTHQALPKGKFLPRKHPINVRFGNPLRFKKKMANQDESEQHKLYRDIANDVSCAIQMLM